MNSSSSTDSTAWSHPSAFFKTPTTMANAKLAIRIMERKGDRPLLEMQHARFLSVTVKSIVKGKTTGTRRGRQVPWSNLKGMARIRVRQNGAAFWSVPFSPSCPFPPFALSLPPPPLCFLCGLCGYPCFRLAPPFAFFPAPFFPIALPFRGADGAAPSPDGWIWPPPLPPPCLRLSVSLCDSPSRPLPPVTPWRPGGSPAGAAAGIPGRCSG